MNTIDGSINYSLDTSGRRARPNTGDRVMHSMDGNDPPDQDDPLETYRCPACGWRSPGGEAEDAGPYGGCPRCSGALVAASGLQGYAGRLVDDLDDSTTEVLSLEQQLTEARQDQARRRAALRSWLEQQREAEGAWRRDELRKARVPRPTDGGTK